MIDIYGGYSVVKHFQWNIYKPNDDPEVFFKQKLEYHLKERYAIWTDDVFDLSIASLRFTVKRTIISKKGERYKALFHLISQTQPDNAMT